MMLTTRRFASSFVSLCLAAVALAAFAVAEGRAGESPSPEKEKELLAVLRSDAPEADKALACKNLAVHGSSDAVPDLAKLLTNERLASWARIPLEAMPGPAADEALRNALGSLEGKLLIGTINSIGVRRDANAVETLNGKLQDRDVEVASAAAAALGHIGNENAAKSLRQSLAAVPVAVRSAVAEGLVLCAERFATDGQTAEAAEIYDAVRTADVPRQRILEATRGAILARRQEGLALLLEQFRSPDNALFQVGLSTAREFKGNAVDKALATELKALAEAKPERAALLITAMADRRDTVELAAVLAAATGGPKPVRLSAIDALGRVGDASCLSPLLEIGVEADADIVQTAKSALGELPGDSVNKDIVARITAADGKLYLLLVELIGQRRIAALDALVKALEHSDKAVRNAALASLGTTVPAKDLHVLISQVVEPKRADDKDEAQQALKTACVRMPDREACAAELATAIERAPVPTKLVLLEILSEVGGPKALATVAAAAKASEPELQDAGSRILGKWLTIDAAPVLLDLTKSAPGERFKIRALRGYMGVARRFYKTMSDEQRIEMCQRAFEASSQPAEQKLVLEMLQRLMNLEALKLAVKATRDFRDLKDESTATTLAIAQKLGDKADEIRKILADADLQKVKLEIVKAEYGAGDKQKDVTEIVKKQAAGVQIVSLAQATYNEAFGGDPAAGETKQLMVKYKVNDKEGEATFAENALIVLPTPK